jgi:hypothetical protein
MLQKLKARIQRVHPGMQQLSLHHDNVRPHMSTQMTAEIHCLGFTVFYSPDLATSDFDIFPKLKEHLRGHHFLSDNELKKVVKV